jgi:Carbonic anhydrase
MSVTDELLENNAAYAESFDKADLPLPPARGVAVVACMDARLDVHKILGLEEGDAHVIRNAGGVITDDEIRSLTISQRLLGTREVVLIHHTDCGMLTFSDDELKAQILEEVGVKPHLLDGVLFEPGGGRAPVDSTHQGESLRPAQGERTRLYLRGGDGAASGGILRSLPGHARIRNARKRTGSLASRRGIRRPPGAYSPQRGRGHDRLLLEGGSRRGGERGRILVHRADEHDVEFPLRTAGPQNLRG